MACITQLLFIKQYSGSSYPIFRFYTYGDMELNQVLDFIDSNYLISFDRKQIDSSVPMETRWKNTVRSLIVCKCLSSLIIVLKNYFPIGRSQVGVFLCYTVLQLFSEIPRIFLPTRPHGCRSKSPSNCGCQLHA